MYCPSLCTPVHCSQTVYLTKHGRLPPKVCDPMRYDVMMMSSVFGVCCRSNLNLMIRQQSHTSALIVNEGQPLRRRHTVNSRFPSRQDDRRANIARFVRLVSSEGLADSDRYALEPAEVPTTQAGVTMETTTASGAAEHGLEAEEETGRSEDGVKVETGSGEEGVMPESPKPTEEALVDEMKIEYDAEDEREEGDEEGEGEEEEGDARTALDRVPSVDLELRDSPAFKFITRPDLYKFAKVSSFNITCAFLLY